MEEPAFVKTFRAHGVDIVHVAEFHVAHTPEFIAERLPRQRSGKIVRTELRALLRDL